MARFITTGGYQKSSGYNPYTSQSSYASYLTGNQSNSEDLEFRKLETAWNNSEITDEEYLKAIEKRLNSPLTASKDLTLRDKYRDVQYRINDNKVDSRVANGSILDVADGVKYYQERLSKMTPDNLYYQDMQDKIMNLQGTLRSRTRQNEFTDIMVRGGSTQEKYNTILNLYQDAANNGDLNDVDKYYNQLANLTQQINNENASAARGYAASSALQSRDEYKQYSLDIKKQLKDAIGSNDYNLAYRILDEWSGVAEQASANDISAAFTDLNTIQEKYIDDPKFISRLPLEVDPVTSAIKIDPTTNSPILTQEKFNTNNVAEVYNPETKKSDLMEFDNRVTDPSTGAQIGTFNPDKNIHTLMNGTKVKAIPGLEFNPNTNLMEKVWEQDTKTGKFKNKYTSELRDVAPVYVPDVKVDQAGNITESGRMLEVLQPGTAAAFMQNIQDMGPGANIDIAKSNEAFRPVDVKKYEENTAKYLGVPGTAEYKGTGQATKPSGMSGQPFAPETNVKAAQPWVNKLTPGMTPQEAIGLSQVPRQGVGLGPTMNKVGSVATQPVKVASTDFSIGMNRPAPVAPVAPKTLPVAKKPLPAITPTIPLPKIQPINNIPKQGVGLGPTYKPPVPKATPAPAPAPAKKKEWWNPLSWF